MEILALVREASLINDILVKEERFNTWVVEVSIVMKRMICVIHKSMVKEVSTIGLVMEVFPNSIVKWRDMVFSWEIACLV